MRAQPSRSPAVLLAVMLLGGFPLSACGSSGAGTTPGPGLSPTESPSVPLKPKEAVSIKSRKVEGDGFTILVPARFEEKSAPGAEESTNYLWSVPPSGGTPTYIAVIPDPKPKSSAYEQSKVKELAVEGVKEDAVSRSTTTWPGASQVVFLQWQETVGGSGEVVTIWQLMAQRESGGILNVVARAPQAEFERLGLPEVMATFKLTQ